MVALVDSQGKQVGSTDVFTAHQHPPQLHAASSVWLWRKTPLIEVLFQQRNAHKPIGAQWWGNTVCGNVKPNESYEACAYRRLQDELNISASDVQLTPLYTFTYKAYGNQDFSEYEFDQMYTGQFSDPSFETKPILPNPNEVIQTAWLPIHQLVTWAQSLSFPTAEESLNQSWAELATTTKPHIFLHQEKNFTIAPWIIFMLRDSRLKNFFDTALLG